jgi:hypothetical protein
MGLNWNLFSPFPIKEACKVSFQICIFKKILFPITYSRAYFKYILHQFAYRFSLVEFELIQLNINPIVELHLLELELNLTEFKFH